ncbi:MAG: hypothetical protein HZB38_08505, partial [Planctomycetes bacterium]|nr:hypothetical protein [Planctomycetota bacterium]
TSPHRLHSTSIFDGETETIVGFDESGQPAYRRVRPRAFATYWASTLESEARVIPGGFIGCWGDTQIESLDADSNGWVGFRQLGQANTSARPYLHEKRYDPLHGYREVLAIHANFPAADWQLAPNWADRYERSPAIVSQAETGAPPERYAAEVKQWAELRPGLWYPALRTSRDLIQLADGSWTPRVIPNCENCRSVHYEAVAAEPLDSVDPAAFVIPDEWARAPLQN